MSSTTSSSTSAQPAVPTTEPRVLLLNAAVAALLGSGLMVLVHETVHLVTGLFMGIGGTQYSYGVDHDGTYTATQAGIMAISAPMFSLVSGFVLAFWTPLRSRGGFGHLLWLMFAFTSIMEGVGYFVITPFGAGDTAAAVEHFGWPVWTVFVLCGLGVALQFLTARLYAPHVGRHAGNERPSKLAFAFWSWVVFCVVEVVVTGVRMVFARMELSAGEVLILMLAGIVSFVFSPMALLYPKTIAAQDVQPLRLAPIPVAGLFGFVALTALNVVLDFGIHVPAP